MAPPLGYSHGTFGVPLGYRCVTAMLPLGYHRVLPLAYSCKAMDEDETIVESSERKPPKRGGWVGGVAPFRRKNLDETYLKTTGSITVAKAWATAKPLLNLQNEKLVSGVGRWGGPLCSCEKLGRHFLKITASKNGKNKERKQETESATATASNPHTYRLSCS